MQPPAPEPVVTGLCSAAFFSAMQFDQIVAIWRMNTCVCVGPTALAPHAGQFTTLLVDAAAVDAAVVGQPAVVGPDGIRIPVAILNSELQGYQTLQGHRITNDAKVGSGEHRREVGTWGAMCGGH